MTQVAVHWSQRGACRNTDPALFHADDQRGTQVYARALAWCAVCPVTRQCLDWALEVHSPSSDQGVWGNTTPEQRRPCHRGDCEHGSHRRRP